MKNKWLVMDDYRFTYFHPKYALNLLHLICAKPRFQGNVLTRIRLHLAVRAHILCFQGKILQTSMIMILHVYQVVISILMMSLYNELSWTQFIIINFWKMLNNA